MLTYLGRVVCKLKMKILNRFCTWFEADSSSRQLSLHHRCCVAMAPGWGHCWSCVGCCGSLLGLCSFLVNCFRC